MNPDPLIMRDELRRLAGGVSSETIRRWMVSGRLPRPDFHPSLKTMGWRRSTLVAAGLVDHPTNSPAPLLGDAVISGEERKLCE